jgi:hypothetical protein
MRSGLALALALSLGACGGGGTSAPAPAPPPAAVNRAPTFTSAATASIVENGTAAYQAAATDPDGNALTFSIAGGADAARFTISTAGALAFNPAPNFELPADADANNVYEVRLGVSDGALGATLDLSVTVTNSREGIAVRRVGTGFSDPVQVVAIPGSSDVFVVERAGNIYRFTPGTGGRTLALTVGSVSIAEGQGVQAMALMPDFAASGRVLVSATTGANALGATIELRLYALGGGPGAAYTTVLSIPGGIGAPCAASGYLSAWLGFGPDGYLYATIGGTGAGDVNFCARNPNFRVGKVLRLAINAGAGAPFVPAPGNPYLGGGGDPYVFALGLQHPYRASFSGDRLLIADRGAILRYQELDLILTSEPGRDFGWSYFEGPAQRSMTGTAPAGLTAPVSYYRLDVGDPARNGFIVGGFVYRGPVASLVGSYIFGNSDTGPIWSVPAVSLVQGSLLPSTSYERRNADFAPDIGTIANLASFGEDAAGNLFIVDSDGEIFMVVPG